MIIKRMITKCMTAVSAHYCSSYTCRTLNMPLIPSSRMKSKQKQDSQTVESATNHDINFTYPSLLQQTEEGNDMQTKSTSMEQHTQTEEYQECQDGHRQVEGSHGEDETVGKVEPNRTV